MIQVLLAQALNTENNAKTAQEAVTLLRTALAREPESVEGYMQLAMAQGRTGNLAEFFAASPLSKSGLKVKRSKDRPRKIAL